MTTDTTTENRAKECARQCLESIVKMVAALDAAGDDDEKLESAEREIGESAYGLTVRSGWHAPGSEGTDDNGEFQILLAGGGPAVRIIGSLDDGSPYAPQLQYSDWYMFWTDYNDTGVEEGAALLRYCEEFCFVD